MKCIHHQQHRCTLLIATSSELEPILTAAQEECTPSLEVDTRRSLLRRAGVPEPVASRLFWPNGKVSGKCQQLFDEYTATTSACTLGNYR